MYQIIKKLILLTIIFNISAALTATIQLNDYNPDLLIPSMTPVVSDTTTDIPQTSFSFKIGKFDSALNVFGSWKIELGYGAGLTLYPELAWILTNPEMIEGIKFNQERLISLDWITDNGIYLHLFFNDRVEDTEFDFSYTPGKFFNKLYITNMFKGLQINPYRKLEGGKAQDVNFGFDWGNKIYKGRFDVQFDSVQYVTDRFKGGKKEIDSKLLSNQFERGIYYYLPDTDITGICDIYVNDEDGNYLFERNYRRLEENTDYVLNPETGTLYFTESVHNKKVLIYYQAQVNNTRYAVGAPQLGIGALPDLPDLPNGRNFNKTTYPAYFYTHEGTDYLILADANTFSYFEEKNAYKIAGAGTPITNLNAYIFDENNEKQSGYTIYYDQNTGCMKVTKSNIKGSVDTIYPFYDLVDPTVFYETNHSPAAKYSKAFIDYSCLLNAFDLKLSSRPVPSSISVFYNSVLLDPSQYVYDFVTGSIMLTFETSYADVIEVSYITDDTDSYNLSFILKNDFRLNDHLILGDSFYYKMPIKLWEDSYYFNMHSIEFLYFGRLSGDFSHYLIHDKNGKLGFDLNAGFSLFYPELKGLTIIEDFEYEPAGKKIPLTYADWYPVHLPQSVFNALAGASTGKLYFRNMHQYGILESNNFISLTDSSAPDKETYSNGKTIGPYNSADGFTYDLSNQDFKDKTNTLSLVTEFELGANEGVSIVFPIEAFHENIDFSTFDGLTVALKREILNGTLRLYIDGGDVTERFTTTDTHVQTEQLDEGIEYTINGTLLYKGKNDGRLQTNDLDGNGLLDPDDATGITRFIKSDTSTDYTTISAEYNNFTYTIEDRQKLKNMRGIRLTLYSPTGASGRLLFNQIRFIESSWVSDPTKNSIATEISPIEDPYLLDHIFSDEQQAIDSKLHFSRFRERTLRIDLAANEDFYVEKRFGTPVTINNFDTLSFFILPKNQAANAVKITLMEGGGEMLTDQMDISTLSSGKWHRLDFPLASFKGYDQSKQLIERIRIEFINTGAVSDNVIYVDEIFLDDPNPSFGFACKNEFIYREPGMRFLKNDLVIFGAPYVKLTTSFNTDNFLVNELKPAGNHIFTNDLVVDFKFIGLDVNFHSLLDVYFRDYTASNPAEQFRFTIKKPATGLNPLFFTINYDYTKNALAGNTVYSAYKTEKRYLLLEVGATFTNYITFKAGYDVGANKKDDKKTENMFYTGYALQINDINASLTYSIKNSSSNTTMDGIFSLDNLGYLLSDDFIAFGRDGYRKEQHFDWQTGFYLLPPLFFSHTLKVDHHADTSASEDTTLNTIRYLHNISCDVQIMYDNEEASFFTLTYGRHFENVNEQTYSTLTWDHYFEHLANSVSYVTPLFYYPPFSSLYKSGDTGDHFYNGNIAFNVLEDEIEGTWDWLIFLDQRLCLPTSFSTKFKEVIVNTLTYRSSYYITLLLSGAGELYTQRFRSIEINYTLSELVKIADIGNTYTTNTGFVINFYTFTDIDIESSIYYDFIVADEINNQKISHKITASNYIYKNFFKKNYVTGDKAGLEMSFLTRLSARFHNRLDSLTVTTVDNPLDLKITPKIGWRFNKNFTITGILNLGYSLDYYQATDSFVHRLGMEFSIEGVWYF